MNAIQVTEYGFNNASFPIYRYLFELKEDDDACKKSSADRSILSLSQPGSFASEIGTPIPGPPA